MKTRSSSIPAFKRISARKVLSLKALVSAIAACTALPYQAYAGPSGGVVVDGAGSINQTGSLTNVTQISDRLSLNWNTFNVARNERVQFVQPATSSIVLNRILDSNASQILGRIDANGRVILMNPNGILFGNNAAINVGGLIASGLNITSSDFMNGNLVFSEVANSAGYVTNRGIITASSGGSVALLGKNVINSGVISADLGHVALASGAEAIVTFDDDGLIGVQINRETLASEANPYAVQNSGTVGAKGGKILLTAATSADLFSEAVNHGGLNGSTDVVLHDDGSFTLGTSNNVINTGTLSVSTGVGAPNDAGYVVLAGHNVEQRGTILANASGDNLAGQVYLEAYNQVRMTNTSVVEANADRVSGKVSINADTIQSTAAARTETTGNTYLLGYLNARLPNIDTNHLYVGSVGTVTQAAPVVVRGNTHLSTASGTDVRLANTANDFNTLTITSNYNDKVAIVDGNDIVLGDISMDDSSLNVKAVGTISQIEDSNLFLGAGTLQLTAANVILGGNGSSTDLVGVKFYVDFTESIRTNGSVELRPYSFEGDNSNSVRIRARDSYTNDVTMDLRGKSVIEANVTQIGDTDINIERIIGTNLTLSSPYTYVTQTGPIDLSGALTWNSYYATLTHPENDVASIQGSGGPAMGSLSYVDKNDLIIRNLQTGDEVTVGISSVGAGATLKQAANTTLRSDFVYLKADNVILGANGTSLIDGGFVLNVDFNTKFELNGPWSLRDYFGQGPFFSVRGTDGPNQFIYGKYAGTGPFSDAGFSAAINIDLMGGNDTATFHSEFLLGGDPSLWGTMELNMGSGNDRVVLNQNMDIPILLGAGADTITRRNSSITYDVLDFNPVEDVITP